MIFKPSRVHLAASAAEGITSLNAFDNALMKVGLADYNLLKVTSVFPPGARLVDVVDVPAGSLLPCVYTSLADEEAGEKIAAAISLGIPEDPTVPGVVMEVSGRYSSEEAQERAKRMVVEAMERRCIGEYEVKSVAVEHHVKSCGCVAAILLLLP
jgi:arginine decarboxylase